VEKKLFREKSIDRINSPEAMKDYMQVATPGIWMLIVAIAILLLGAVVWSVMGNVETRVPAVIVMNNGRGECYFAESSKYTVTLGMKVRIDGEDYEITNVSTLPHNLSSDEEYIRGMLEIDNGSLVVTAETNAYLSDGIYRGSIITEEITPIKFLTN